MLKIKFNKFLVIILLLSGSLAYGAQESGIEQQNKKLLNAARYLNLEGVRNAIANGANVNAIGHLGYTSLMMASIYQVYQVQGLSNEEMLQARISIVKLLIENGADVNAVGCDYCRDTALINAAEFGQIEVVVALLLAGADINYRNQLGKSAYELAKEWDHLGTAAVLQAWPEIKKIVKDEVAAQLDETGILLDALNKIVAEYAVGYPEEESKESSEK